MRLRILMEKDADAMLEWMHDSDIVEKMGTDFQSKTVRDCINFINDASNDNNNVHRAIVNDSDEYLGTVSLKRINPKEQTAEFAIVVCKKALGTGVASEAMREILHLGRDEFRLKSVFWCVRKDNIRANKFYNKNGYQKTNDIPEYLRSSYNNSELNWFCWTGGTKSLVAHF